MLYIVLDVETTGMKTDAAKVIEVAAVVLNEKYEEVDSFSSLANPGFDAMTEADPEAMATNGISVGEIAAASCHEDVAQDFEAFLDKHWGGLLFAFNKDFDSWFLGRSPWNVSPQKWGECIMLASMDAMAKDGKAELRKGGSPKWPSLVKAAAFFGVAQEGAHRALVDARTAAQVYAKILSKRDELRYMQESANESIQLLDQGY